MRTLYTHARLPDDVGSPALDRFAVDGDRFADPDPDAHWDRVVDLNGAVIRPAFMDLHTHPSIVAETLDALAATPPLVDSIESLIERLREHAATHPEGWILGWGYDESLLAEHRTPTREDLNRVSATRPVMVRRSDCHRLVVNDAALRLAGIDESTPDPAGGRWGRDAEGRLTGEVIEIGAVRRIEAAMKPAADGEEGAEAVADPEAAAVASLLKLEAYYARRGITRVTEMMAERGPVDMLSVWRKAQAQGLSVLCGIYQTWTGGRDPYGMPELSDDEKTGDARIAGVKLFSDGSVSAKSAKVRVPYADGTTGESLIDDEVFRAAFAWAKRNGVQVSIHVMGDATLEYILELVEPLEPWMEGVPSVRLEHASFVPDDLLERILAVKAGIGITTQPIFPFAEWPTYRASLTEARLSEVMPLAKLAGTDLPLALSSDAPATTWADPDDVFATLQSATTRVDASGRSFGAGEAVEVRTALLLYGERAARVMPALSPYGFGGTMRPGERADFVRLSEDPLAVPGADVRRVKVLATVSAGVLRYGELG